SIICIGLSTNLTASGASTYKWSPIIGLSASVGANNIAAPVITTDYTVIGTDTNGCRDTAFTNVIVKPLPNIVITPDSSVICEYDTIMFNTSGANTYLWSPSSGLSSTAGSQITAIPLTNTTYTVIGTDTNGCIDSTTAFVNVNPKPNSSINPSVAAICIGDSTTLTAISNIPGTTYLWNTSSTMNSISVTPSYSSTYTLTATSPYGCIDTTFSVVNIHPYPSVNILPINPILCKGDSMWLYANSSINNLNYIWSTTAIADSIYISPTVVTTYTVVGSDTAGCSGSDTVILIPHQKPSVSYTTGNTTICAGDSAIINAVSSYTGLTYLWNTGAPTPTIIVSPTIATTYTVSATDSFGCFDTASAVIYINPIPVPTISPNNPTICYGDSTTLTASCSVLGANYQWSNGALVNSTTVYPVTTTSYSVTTSDIIGCKESDTCVVTVEYGPPITISPTNPEICYGDTTTLTASSTVAGVTYQWNTSTLGNTISVNPLVNTLYYVVGTNSNGCRDTTQASVIVNPNPVININPNNSGICLGDSIQLNANSNVPIMSCQWSNGCTVNPMYFKPNITSSIIIIATDSNLCVGTDTAFVTVTPTPTSVINAISPICSADSTIVTYSGTGTTSATYNWNFAGGTIISGTNQGPYAIKWISGGNYNIILTVSENNCTSDPDTAQVIVNQTPIVDFSASPLSACEFAEVQFTNLTTNIATFNWNFGDPWSSNNTSTLENPLHLYSASGLYNVALTVISNDGCPANTTKLGFISVNPNPTALFYFTPDQPDIENPIVDFINISTGSTAWYWDFGDPNSGINNFSNIFSPSHLFSDTGYFHVWLIVENTFGCLDSAMLEVPIKDIAKIKVPNAFIPASSGENNRFFPKGYNIDWSTLEFYIFDRWGEQIYFTKDVNEGWDGTKNGGNTICQQGVYAWLIFVKDIYGEKIKLKGTVTLLR
ncbi:MAG: PKD domain-containing protein, partial [Saprospiraceae bacterium]|nr:PKD domain-containing protein [Saprospiraceae bacterium]